jgi:uncharacterized lipoprotein NlpE involved in copper resistance
MNKTIFVLSALVLSLNLVGCNSMGDGSQMSNQTLGQGFKYTAHVVSSGTHLVSDTGAAIGQGAGKVVHSVSGQ